MVETRLERAVRHALPGSEGAPDPLARINDAYRRWVAQHGKDPDFLVCRFDHLNDLREQMKSAIKTGFLGSLDDMRKQAASGGIKVGGFIVVLGPQYGAGKWS